ncbi:MAG: hypothetical protein AAF153_01150 [Pseudomonadota bacterium]
MIAPITNANIAMQQQLQQITPKAVPTVKSDGTVMQKCKQSQQQLAEIAEKFTANYFYKVMQETNKKPPKSPFTDKVSTAHKFYNQMLNMELSKSLSKSPSNSKLKAQIVKKLNAYQNKECQ